MAQMRDLKKAGNVPCFKSAHLNRLIAVRRFDRGSLIALADAHYFPTELIDELGDILENELIRIIIKNGKERVIIPIKPIPINSTEELKQVIRQHPKDTVLCFTDAFICEYFDRVYAGMMTEPQLDFYARIFKYYVPKDRPCRD